MKMDRIEKSDEQYKAALSPEAYRIARHGGTERAFTGAYWNCHDAGVYHCVCCGLELFASETKFESGSGWPSFYDVQESEHVELREDPSGGRVRTALHCARCDARLGHLFDDGPRPTGLRYCINSASLLLDQSEGE
jgi:peptide-methionine (R)-S-oxide reductase